MTYKIKAMTETKLTAERAMEILLMSYRRYYNIYEKPDPEEPLLTAECHYHQHDEKYVLTREAQLWETNEHEYAYLFKVEELDLETYDHILSVALEKGKALIKPIKNHMASYIACVILCDRMTPEAAKAVKRSHFRKSFRFSWYGWMELRTAAAPVSGGDIVSNRAGRSTAKFLYRVFQPRKKTSHFGKRVFK